MPDSYQNIKELFENAGGQVITPPEDIALKLNGIKAFVFDWDGVFNDGAKGGNAVSTFTETDSMGTNLLRFSHWMKHAALPYAAIITGQNNQVAKEFASRESFDAVYLNYKDKSKALDALLADTGFEEAEIAFFFDDVLDLAIARRCGLRFLVHNSNSPLFSNYVLDHHLADYITSKPGGFHAVREVCELCIGLMGQYEKCLEERIGFSLNYQRYLNARNTRQPKTLIAE